MSFLKYVIDFDNRIEVAILMNLSTEICAVGGKSRGLATIENILVDYFGVKRLPQPIWVQKNKIRYEFSITKNVFLKCIQMMEDNGLPIGEVYKLGNIMR